ncbi:hypothetical protein, partial [Salmonella sp. SAL4436]|uniref:hypothetical protein n=1 Tax=Salmonella sp. SAL4436 TaxID=3159891 RepID=UPI00397A39F0
VDLRGDDWRRVAATASIEAETVEEHLAARIREQIGLDPSAVTLAAPDTLTIVVLGLPATGRLAIADDGSLVLRIASEVLDDIVLV